MQHQKSNLEHEFSDACDALRSSREESHRLSLEVDSLMRKDQDVTERALRLEEEIRNLKSLVVTGQAEAAVEQAKRIQLHGESQCEQEFVL